MRYFVRLACIILIVVTVVPIKAQEGESTLHGTTFDVDGETGYTITMELPTKDDPMYLAVSLVGDPELFLSAKCLPEYLEDMIELPSREVVGFLEGSDQLKKKRAREFLKCMFMGLSQGAFRFGVMVVDSENEYGTSNNLSEPLVGLPPSVLSLGMPQAPDGKDSNE